MQSRAIDIVINCRKTGGKVRDVAPVPVWSDNFIKVKCVETRAQRTAMVLADSFCPIINKRNINQSFDFASTVASTLLMTSWNELFLYRRTIHLWCVVSSRLLAAISSGKQTREMCAVYCIHTGFWLPIPTGPTFWDSLVIIIGMTFMPINIVAVELCPHVNPPPPLSFLSAYS